MYSAVTSWTNSETLSGRSAFCVDAHMAWCFSCTFNSTEFWKRRPASRRLRRLRKYALWYSWDGGWYKTFQCKLELFQLRLPRWFPWWFPWMLLNVILQCHFLQSYTIPLIFPHLILQQVQCTTSRIDFKPLWNQDREWMDGYPFVN